MITPKEDSLFFGLDDKQFKHVIATAELLDLDSGARLITDGVVEHSFYYLIEGTLKIVKKSGKKEHLLAELHEGETVGEMALIDDAPRSASVICDTPCKLYRFDIDKLNDNPQLMSVINHFIKKIGKKMTDRLRTTNTITVDALKDKYVMSIFFIRILIVLTLYTLSLNLIEQSKRYFSSTTFLSLGLIVLFALVFISIIRQSGKPYSFYGFTTQNFFKNCIEALLFSIPVMLIIVLIKWLVITYFDAFNQLPLFDHTAPFKKRMSFSWDTYFLFMFLYALFCPVQEFIVRGSIQTSLQYLLEGSVSKVKWNAIIVSNLLFASTHSHTSLGFAVLSFVPGLFWGWMYYRQKSLVGVCLSHILIGVWAAFIVGFQNML